jgi:hypothetical protein
MVAYQRFCMRFCPSSKFPFKDALPIYPGYLILYVGNVATQDSGSTLVGQKKKVGRRSQTRVHSALKVG